MTKEKHNGPYPKEIDYKTLSSLCKIQCTGEECAAILEMDYDTLNTRLDDDGHGGFSDYFKIHSSSGKASLRRRQIAVALDGNPTMLIWMGKQHLGQTDKSQLTGDENSPIALTQVERIIVKPTNPDS
jgi:hypothetical protein